MKLALFYLIKLLQHAAESAKEAVEINPFMESDLIVK